MLRSSTPTNGRPASPQPPDLNRSAVFQDGARIDLAVEEARRAAYLRHFRMGVPVVVEVNGEVRAVAAEELLAQNGWLDEALAPVDAAGPLP